MVPELIVFVLLPGRLSFRMLYAHGNTLKKRQKGAFRTSSSAFLRNNRQCGVDILAAIIEAPESQLGVNNICLAQPFAILLKTRAGYKAVVRANA